MSLRIVHFNDPILRKKGEPVTVFDAALRKLATDMVVTMHTAAGIGLAAQQIGRTLQLCVVDLRESDADFGWELDGAHPPLELFMPMVVINPVITIAKGTPTEIVEEGCLSFPEIRGDVKRAVAITVKFHDERGVPHVLLCDDLLARCVLHEADHLNGILFIDHMTKKTYAKIDEAVKALAQETKAAAKK
jgi:peptide deformylase